MAVRYEYQTGPLLPAGTEIDQKQRTLTLMVIFADVFRNRGSNAQAQNIGTNR